MKKTSSLMLILACLVALSACEDKTDTPEVAKTDEPVSSSFSECPDETPVPGAYCPYVDEPFIYDITWAKEALPYSGDGHFWNFAEFNSYDSEKYVYMDALPVTLSEYCAKPLDNSDELLGYKSAEECVCEIFNDNLIYYDINEAVAGIDQESAFNYVYYPVGPSGFGIAFKDTLFYEAVKDDQEIINIPSCFRDLHFVANGKFYENETELLDKYVRNGERNYHLELFVSKSADYYFLSVSLDGVNAYGYIEINK